MLVKAHQPHLREDMHTVFALPPTAGERRTVAATVDSGHGRIEPWHLRTSTILVGDSEPYAVYVHEAIKNSLDFEARKMLLKPRAWPMR
jgi:hypothetical protein